MSQTLHFFDQISLSLLFNVDIESLNICKKKGKLNTLEKALKTIGERFQGGAKNNKPESF